MRRTKLIQTMKWASWGGVPSHEVFNYSAPASIRCERSATVGQDHGGCERWPCPQCLPSRVEPAYNGNSSHICSRTCDMPNYTLKHDTDLHAQNSAGAAGPFLSKSRGSDCTLLLAASHGVQPSRCVCHSS
jgi:hypothetical protein